MPQLSADFGVDVVFGARWGGLFRVQRAILAVVLGCAGLQASYGQTVWTAGADDWFTPANWTLGVPNAASGTAFDAIIANGGTPQISAPGGSVRRLRVGLAGGPGSLVVDGGSLAVTENLHLNEGSSGLASVTVQNGATITSPSTIVGFSSAADTNFLISGAGTTFNAATQFIVGHSGAGTASLTVESGAVLTSGIGYLGNLAGSHGVGIVRNPGSSWSSAGTFAVGNLGVGTLTIEDQGLVSAGTNLYIAATSNVNLNGGRLRFATIDGPGGVSRINYNSGTVQIPNVGFPSPTITGLFGASPTIPAGKTLVVETSAFFFSGGSLGVTGGNLEIGSIPSFTGSALGVSSGNVSIGGDFTVNTGALSASGPDSFVQIGGSLRIQTSPNFGTPNATLNVSDGASVFVTGDLTIDHPGFNFPPLAAVNLSGGTLRFNGYTRIGNDTGSRFNYTGGTIQLASDRNIGSDPTISALYGAAPAIAAGKGLAVEGIAMLTAPALTLSGGTLTAETLAMMPGSRIKTSQASQVTGAIVALAGSVLDATGGALAIGSSSKVNGFYSNGSLLVGANTVTLADANDAVLDSAALVTLGAGGNPGTLAAANGLTLDFGGNVVGFGAIETPNDITKPLINNGHITGESVAEPITLSGYVKGVGTLDNVSLTGTFAPGLSPTIFIAGNLAFAPTSTLVMEIGGITPGSGHDQVQSSGALDFAGTLQATLLSSFAPTAGQSFDLFDWNTASGAFETLLLPTLASGLSWNTSQLYTTGVLSVTAAAGIPGDYNNNGTVDAADYTLYRDALGTNATLPNDTTPGSVTAADYTVWQANFGAGGPSAASAVPEPAAVLLLIGGLLLRIRRF